MDLTTCTFDMMSKLIIQFISYDINLLNLHISRNTSSTWDIIQHNSL